MIRHFMKLKAECGERTPVAGALKLGCHMRPATFLLAASLLQLAAGQPALAKEKPEFVGHSYDLRYDNGFHVIDSFINDESLHFKVLSAPTPGREGTVTYHWQRVAPHIYAIYWTEADGGVVVHVDDFQTRISRSYYTPPGKSVVPSMATIP